MEVRTGYKQTEIGVIPNEWEVKILGELATFRTGPFGSALHKSDYTEDGVPVVNPMHLIDGGIVPSRTMTVTEAAARLLPEFRLKPGEIVIGRRGDMGRCAVAREPHTGWLCGTGSMIIRPLPQVDSHFLQRVLSSPSVVAAIEGSSVGSTMVNLNQQTLSQLAIQTPPLQEQRAIAAALSDVDALLAKLDQLIAKKRDLKQAAMQQLLTGQTRLPGFGGTWDEHPLSSVIDRLEAGVSVNSVDEAEQVGDQFILKTSAVANGNFIVSECKPVAPKDWNRAKLNPQRNTILISRMNTPHLVGEIGYVDKDYPNLYLPDRLWMAHFRSGADISVKWLAYLLASRPFKRLLRTSATGTSGSMKNISKDTFLSFRVRFPAGSEQTAIATVLSEMDAEIAALEVRRDKTRLLKQGMMQELLTGRIRLV